MTMLAGKIAVVTGASSGLGRHFALTLAAEGAAVVLVARREHALADLAKEIRQAGGKALVCPADLADGDAIAPLFDAAEKAFGPVDILINNAAIPDADFATRLSMETINQVINVDFRAPFLLAREMANRLIAREQPGRIVNIASVGVLHYTPRSASALYCSCKAAIVRMTETLAIEWSRYGINVNAISPGMVESEMTAGFIERVGHKVKNTFPRKRFGKPEDMDSTLLYLLDPRSHFVTGACITVDDAQVSR